MGDANLVKQQAMITALLEELQPKMKSKKKDAIDTFENYYFKTQPRLSHDDLHSMLIGNSSNFKVGLVHACGATSWKFTGLQAAAGKAMGLLQMFLDAKQNEHYRDCVTVFKGLQSQYDLNKLLAIEKHLASSNNDKGNSSAAMGIKTILGCSLQDLLDAAPVPQSEEEEKKHETTAGQHERSDTRTSMISFKAPERMVSHQSIKPSDTKKSQQTADGKQSSGNAFLNMLAGFFGGNRVNRGDLVKKGVLQERGVFGNDLSRLQSAGKCNSDGVPLFIVDLSQTLLQEGHVSLEGIFRVSGDSSDISYLQKAIDFNQDYNLKTTTPHVLSGLFKKFYRDLPEPLLTYDLYTNFVECFRDGKTDSIPGLVEQLPGLESAVFEHLLQFLCHVASLSDVNKMTAKNLAIVFAPNLLRPRIETYETMAVDTPFCIGAIQVIIETRLETMMKNKAEAAADDDDDRVGKSARQDDSATSTAENDEASAKTEVVAQEEKKKPAAMINPMFAEMAAKKAQKQQPAAVSPSSTRTASIEPAVIEPSPAVAVTTESTSTATDGDPAEQWTSHVDGSTGKTYYYNEDTDTTQWHRPSSVNAVITAVSDDDSDDMEDEEEEPSDDDTEPVYSPSMMQRIPEIKAKVNTHEQPATIPEDDQEEEDDLEDILAAARAERAAQEDDNVTTANVNNGAEEEGKETLDSAVKDGDAQVGIVTEPTEEERQANEDAMMAALESLEPDDEDTKKQPLSSESVPEQTSMVQEEAPPPAAVMEATPHAQPVVEDIPPPPAEEPPIEEEEEEETKEDKDEQPKPVYIEWESLVDVNTSQDYFYCPINKTTTWTKPDGISEEMIAYRSDSTLKPGWRQVSITSAWKIGTTAGGCYPNFSKWRENPQIRLALTKANRNAHVIVELKYNFPEGAAAAVAEPSSTTTTGGKKRKRKHHAMGLYVFHNSGPFMHKICVDKDDIHARSNFKTSGNVTVEFDIKSDIEKPTLLPVYLRTNNSAQAAFPRHYTIVPSTYEPNQEGSFTITVHSEKDNVFLKMVSPYERIGSKQQTSITSQWKAQTAGGCKNHASFSNNARYALTSDVEQDVILLLTQGAEATHVMGSYVIDENNVVVAKASFMQAQEVFVQVKMTKNAVLHVVPCTFEPSKENTYSLTAYWSVAQSHVTLTHV